MRLILILRAMRLARLAEFEMARASACDAWADAARDRAEARQRATIALLARIRGMDARA